MYYRSFKNDNKPNLFVDEFAQSEMDQAIIELYGSDISYTNEDINCFAKDGVLYENKDSKYIFSGTHGHGGQGSYRYKSYFVEALKDESKGTIDISKKIIYGGYCGDICGPSSNFYKEASMNAQGLYPQNGEYGESSDYDKAYNEFKDQLPITKFHFEKNSKGYYGLKSISVE